MAKFKYSKTNTGFKVHVANITNNHFMNDFDFINENTNETMSHLNKIKDLTKRYASTNMTSPKLKRVKRQSQSNVTNYTSNFVLTNFSINFKLN
jgi:hypothetical protein